MSRLWLVRTLADTTPMKTSDEKHGALARLIRTTDNTRNGKRTRGTQEPRRRPNGGRETTDRPKPYPRNSLRITVTCIDINVPSLLSVLL